MPLLTAPVLERNVLDAKRPLVILADSVSTKVVPVSIAQNGEYVSIELFNAGPNNAYYAYGRDCNLNNFNAWIVPGQMLVVECREYVSMFSVGGTTIATTALRRMDNINANIQYPA